jgi:hypothetical protein
MSTDLHPDLIAKFSLTPQQRVRMDTGKKNQSLFGDVYTVFGLLAPVTLEKVPSRAQAVEQRLDKRNELLDGAEPRHIASPEIVLLRLL